MKILFVLSYPGYLRYFDSTIRLLAERGHSVYLTFEHPEKQPEGLDALADADERIVVLDPVPKREDAWWRVGWAIRNTADYARYLHPDYAEAPRLRQRMERFVPAALSRIRQVRSVSPPVLRLLLRALRALDEAVPSSPAFEAFIRSVRPDVVLVTPLVMANSRQAEVVKSARALGVPTGLCVGSWDHLTTKGLIRPQPDRVLVWNEIQRAEAAELHGVPPEIVAVTGAQPWDRWFERRPGTTREQFCQKVGLPPERPFALFVGSTASISAPEAEQGFVRAWIGAIRRSAAPAVTGLAALIRPHPYNPGSWARSDLTDLGDVAVWPRHGANPVDENDRADYFDSLYHSAAVVGINTSAMIEAAIVGRPVLTILDSAFADTQQGTLHFRYLLPEHGGFLQVAAELDEHVEQLAATLADPEAALARLERFVATFVRPNGLERPCTGILADEIERLGAARPLGTPRWRYPLRLLLRLILAGADLERTSKAVRTALSGRLRRTDPRCVRTT